MTSPSMPADLSAPVGILPLDSQPKRRTSHGSHRMNEGVELEAALASEERLSGRILRKKRRSKRNNRSRGRSNAETAVNERSKDQQNIPQSKSFDALSHLHYFNCEAMFDDDDNESKRTPTSLPLPDLTKFSDILDDSDHSTLSHSDEEQEVFGADTMDLGLEHNYRNEYRQPRITLSQAQEATSKLANALDGLWIAIQKDQSDATRSFETVNEHNIHQLQEAKKQIRKLTKNCQTLQDHNDTISSELQNLQTENKLMTAQMADFEKDYMNQMDNLVNISVQTERDYKNMVAERDFRVARLEEENMRLREILDKVEDRAEEAELRRQTFSDMSDAGRESIEGECAYSSSSDLEEKLSALEAPFSRRSGNIAGETPPRPQTSKSAIFRQTQDYGPGEIMIKKTSSSLQYMAASSSRGSARDEEMISTGEDEGLHFV